MHISQKVRSHIMSRRGSIVTIVGNRPQFIKMAPISSQFVLRGHKEFIIHTGQHFDDNMSDVFFEELEIPRPHLNLSIASGTHGKMTGTMLIKIEEILKEMSPKGVLIYGDTNSTLAAALAAVKLHIPIAHVESGPRIYDINTPEEINRIVADHAAKIRFCPDLISVQNLAKENIVEGVHFTGDVMYDAFRNYSEIAKNRSNIISTLNLDKNNYALLTIHRPNNTDTPESLVNIINLITNLPMRAVFPVHPRTEAAFKRYNLWDKLKSVNNTAIIPAVGYLDILELVNNAKVVLTDSGGLQKEGYFAGKPVLVLFYTTPWPQIEATGWQKCCWKENGIDVSFILEEIGKEVPKGNRQNLFGNGDAAIKIVDILENQQWLS